MNKEKTIKGDENQPFVYTEECFWQTDDKSLRYAQGRSNYSPNKNKRIGPTINLLDDSYVWCFAGPRGSGKSLTMSYFAAGALAAGMRVVSNYDIKFSFRDHNGDMKELASEPLDLYKILVFDSDFSNCLILMDEAPLIISHLSSMSWKNRLLDIFMQQIRKNRNSFFYASQNERWVDYQLRWQTDLVLRCRDASRRYQGGGLHRGDSILIDITDQSGMWTGWSYDERPVVHAFTLNGRKYFGIFDTYNQMDVFECLKKVDMKLTSYKVGDHEENRDMSHIDIAEDLISNLVNQGVTRVKTRDFYASMPELDQKQKDEVAKHLLNKMNITKGRPTTKGYEYYLKDVKFTAGVAE